MGVNTCSLLFSCKSLRQLQSAERNTRPHLGTRSNIKLLRKTHPLGPRNTRIRNLVAPCDLLPVHQRQLERGRVGKLVRRDGEAEGGVKGWVEDVRAGGVRLGGRDELLVAPGDLDAGVELVAVAAQAADAGDEDGGEAADFALVLALGG